MVDRKPNLSGYARVSYLRELHGDLDGAAEAMRLAVDAGGPAAENGAYVSALLGELERRRGRRGAGRRAFEARARARARLAGGRRRASRGSRAARARDRAAAVVERLPLPEYVIALGETELAAGRDAARGATFALVGAEEQLLRAAASTSTSSSRSSRPTTAIRGGRSSSPGAATRRRARAPRTRSGGR